MAEQYIHWEQKESIGILTLNNPPENYLTEPEFVSMAQLKEWLRDDVHGLIISGAGRHFSAGADFDKIRKQSLNVPVMKDSLLKGNALVNFIAGLELPVVAAISGICFGGGLEIALACDIRICTQRSLFAFPEINLNLIPALGGLKRLQNLCGQRNAMELLMRGDTLNAHLALGLKIVDQVVEEKDCRDIAFQYLNSLTHHRPKKVIQMLMRSFRNAERLAIEEAQMKDVEMFCELALEASLSRKNQMFN